MITLGTWVLSTILWWNETTFSNLLDYGLILGSLLIAIIGYVFLILSVRRVQAESVVNN